MRAFRATTPFALTITDNEPMATTMRRLHGGQPGPGIAVLPPRMPVIADDVFSAGLCRATRWVRAGTPPHWVLVSQADVPPSLVMEPRCWRHLAALRPTHRFDLLGPGGRWPEGIQELIMPNISYHGTLPNLLAADFTQYDKLLVAKPARRECRIWSWR